MEVWEGDDEDVATCKEARPRDGQPVRDDTGEAPEMEPAEATRYRAIAARLNYLAVDRPDVQYAVKEAARAMSRPKVGDWSMLQRIGRYLVGHPRMVMCMHWQEQRTIVTTFTDSDWAGCSRTARSTSGGIITIGQHVVKTYSRQQRVVALSSAEAELYAMVAASAETLAIMAYAQDLGMALSGEVYTDSSAALGISKRAGIGKVRHLRTQGLWVQEVRMTGRLAYHKVLGTKNPADILTKHVPADLLSKHLGAIQVEARGGRAETAPELNSLVSVITAFDGDDDWEPDSAENLDAAVEVEDKAAEETKGKVVKKVSFDPRVQFRAVPSANRGRKCQGRERDTLQTRWEKRVAVRVGVTPRPRWADLTDDEFPEISSVFQS